MSRLSDDIDALRAMAVSRMEPASIAKVLGRSEAWVERQLELLVDAQGREAAVFAAGVERALAVVSRAGRIAALLGRTFARGAVGRRRLAKPMPVWSSGSSSPMAGAATARRSRWATGVWPSSTPSGLWRPASA